MKIATVPIILFLAALPTSVLAQNANEAQPPVLIVTGNAQIDADPDEATVRLGVVKQAPTAQNAQDQANRTAQEILRSIGRLGVPAQRIQTSRLTLTPVYAPRRPDSNEAPKIVAYNASNIVSVDLADLTQIGPVIDAGLTAGANQLEGVNFRLKDDVAVRERAIRQAVAEARRKADAMADALNVRLVGVLEVSESGVSIMPKAEMGGMMAARMVQSSDMATPVSPGQLEVRTSVMVRYRIDAR